MTFRLLAVALGWFSIVVGLAQVDGNGRAVLLDQQRMTPSVLTNGDFENEAEHGAWEMTSNTPPQRSERNAHSGRFSLHSKLVNEGPQPSEGHLRQTVQNGIVGGETYALEFWVREIDFGISYVQQYAVTWLDAAGEEMKEGSRGLTNFRAGKKDWEQVRVGALVAPDEAQGVHLFFRFVTGAVKRGSGEVFVDDIAFQPENAELVTTMASSDQEATLVWQNGDALTGQLLPSEGKRVRWKTPAFLDPLELDTTALDSIRFVPEESQVPGDFRFETVMGDVLSVDIVGADAGSYHVSSPRFGSISIKRSSVFGIRRIENPDQIFEGTKLTDWRAVLGGPLVQASIQVHTIDENAPLGSVVQIGAETLVSEGHLASGFFDVGVLEYSERSALQFEAMLIVPEDGDYQFEFAHGGTVRFWLDDELLLSSANEKTRSELLSLKAGSSKVRFEYIPEPRSKELGLWWSGPGFTKRSLTGANRRWAWREGKAGAPFTRLKTTGIFRAVELPESFHLDLEIESRGEPRFLMGLGRDAQRAEADNAIRLETREHELVLVSDTIYEPLLKLNNYQRQIRLRLSFDGTSRELQVHDLGGQRLAKLEDVGLATEASGILWRNLGQGLTVQRVSVYEIENGGLQEEVDAALSRVHMIDGSVYYGKLFAADGLVEVGEFDGVRRRIDLSEVDRIVHSGALLKPWLGDVQILYADGGIVHGRLASLDEGAVQLRPRFLLDSLVCSLTGATRLQFADSGAYRPPSSHGDILGVLSGRARGQLTFGIPDALLGWSFVGADSSVRFSKGVTAQVARDRSVLSDYYAFDIEAFPSVLHLANGEVIPCKLLSYHPTIVRFESPFLRGSKLDSRHIKALELEPRRNGAVSRAFGRGEGGKPQAKSRIRQQSQPMLEETMMRRALTVPRMNRGRPSSHLMVAVNGDVKRGQLVSIEEGGVRFESKQREMVVPRERVQAVVSVGTGDELLIDESSDDKAESESLLVRVELVDRSVFIFRPVEFKDGRLLGESPIYGELSVPVNQILTVDSGEFDPMAFKSKFGHWLVRPAKEPSFAR